MGVAPRRFTYHSRKYATAARRDPALVGEKRATVAGDVDGTTVKTVRLRSYRADR